MNTEEETYKKFGYHPNDLAPQSHKYVISRCVGCGEIREIQKRHDPGYCRKCAQSKEASPALDRIILTGDWHIGAGSVDFDELKDVAKRYWKGHPVILLGDLVDVGFDKGMNFSNKIQPQEQIDKVEELAELLNVCGYCIGNHDARIFKKTGLNPYKQISSKNQVIILV